MSKTKINVLALNQSIFWKATSVILRSFSNLRKKNNKKVTGLIILTVLLYSITSVIPLAAQESQNLKSNQRNLPSVAPIDPSGQQEEDIVAAPDIYNRNSDVFQYYRESLNQKVISTAERERLERVKNRVERASRDPMDRPAADGTKFIDIYAPSQILNDGTAFHDVNDPDDRYADFENNYLSKAVKQLNMAVMIVQFFSELSDQQNDMRPGAYPGMGNSSYSPGMTMTGNQIAVKPENNKKNDTKLIFEGFEDLNPFAETEIPEINPESAFDFFKADREYKEKISTQNNANNYSNSMMPGMNIGPEAKPGMNIGPEAGPGMK